MSPPVLVKCDKKHGGPYIAVLTVSIANIIMCMLPFGVIIVLDVSLLVASYILVYISAMVLRRRIPDEEYKFKIPGGNGFLSVLCIVPICVALFAFLINGSDYFVGGMIGLITGPILYFFWRRRYGGLTKKDPQRFPVNEKTGLAVGDTRRLAFLFLLMAIMNGLACVFMPWYEGWGTEDMWESGDYFDGMFEGMDVMSILGTIKAILYILTALTVVLTIVFYFVSKKVEPEKQK